ncbi:MAG: hypothetical protein DHS20C18_02280 [Saprospiraceae bacterium]|nr:MAG: hypothetical protein DHS20C18_02280 [Saprospiraceae bacterium]
MKTIQFFLLIFLGICLCEGASAQSFFARYSQHSGQLEEVVVWQTGMAFGLSGQGQLQYVIVDESINEPQKVRNLITTCSYLNKSVTYEGDLRIYHPFSGYLDYYEGPEESHKSGKLSILGTTTLNYYDFSAHSHRNGLLSSIGTFKINYYDMDYPSHKNGKISSIGAFTFDYYDQSTENHKNGTFSRIGPVEVETYDFDYSSHKNGKLSRLGDCRFDYFDFDYDDYQNGKLFEMQGEDDRFILL